MIEFGEGGGGVSHVMLSLLIATAGLAFVFLALLAAAGLVDPRFAAVAFGIAALDAGVDEVAGALVAGWAPLGRWPAGGRPEARLGWLGSLGFGVVLVSTGVVLIGLAWMPQPVLLVAVAVFVAGFALLIGGSYDRGRAASARGSPDAQPSAPADRRGA